ncbi:hypothetical protein SAMN05877838_3799 [Hoeflea halophila]|uniref:AlpA family transcriptional regulator n=1 Tax=Hoeflea halophila TaxID=714899 RepID=A0A286IFD3_9HYPH|nr:hypothetical protein [Hoeflea halophila]SOE18855.1 hypothetical protein SAMN05877838_3799 [Hoeflea halophila]
MSERVFLTRAEVCERAGVSHSYYTKNLDKMPEETRFAEGGKAWVHIADFTAWHESRGKHRSAAEAERAGA